LLFCSDVEYEAWGLVDFALLLWMLVVHSKPSLFGAITAVLQGVWKGAVLEPGLAASAWVSRTFGVLDSLPASTPEGAVADNSWPNVPDVTRLLKQAVGLIVCPLFIVEVAAEALEDLLRPLTKAARHLRLQLRRLIWRAKRFA
jgi:hypothetical protein